MHSIQQDLVVVGSGGAGLAAALAAARAGVRVTVVSKSGAGRSSGTLLAGGGFGAAVGEQTPAIMFQEAVAAGRRLNQPELLEVLAREAGPAITALGEEYGINFEAKPGGQGFNVVAPSISEYPAGRYLVRMMVAAVRAQANVRLLPYFTVTGLLQDANGTCCGVAGFDRQGTAYTLQARAVILATGGAAGSYSPSNTSPALTGDGYALALQAGLSLRDMEFVQFYPMGVVTDRVTCMIHPGVPPDARLVRTSGVAVTTQELVGYQTVIHRLAIHHRDSFSRQVDRARQEGDAICLDLTGVDAVTWATHDKLQQLQQKLPQSRRQPIPLTALAHFTMGGVEVGADCATELPGLWAAGEVTGGLHGANRVGGNALSECLVFGARAGRAAAAGITQLPPVNKLPAQIPLRPWPQQQGSAGPAPELLQYQLRLLNARYLGPFRSAGQLQQAQLDLEQIARQASMASINSPFTLRKAWELKTMLLVTRVILEAALQRTESRGSHYRDDHPQEDITWQHSQTVSLQNDQLIWQTLPTEKLDQTWKQAGTSPNQPELMRDSLASEHSPGIMSPGIPFRNQS